MRIVERLISDYSQLELTERSEVFDDVNFYAFESKDLNFFLKHIILDEEENFYLRKQAIEMHTELVLLDKLKPRHSLTILIDEWKPTDNVHLEVRRLKDLFLFYEFEPTGIQQIYESFKINAQAELQGEAYFQSGLVWLLEAFSAEDGSLWAHLHKSQNDLGVAANIIENRIDAKFW